MKKDLKSKIIYELKCVLMTIFAVTVSFASVYFFVLPAKFSPSGIEGISAMLYELTGWNIGWFKIMINAPLLVLAWIMLNKRYVFYITLYTILDSVGIIILGELNLPVFIPPNLAPESEIGYRLISAIFAGVALGITSGLMLKIGFSTGGMDIIASIIHKKKPHIHTERIISIFCYIVIACSYFVYWDITSILLSIIQIIIFEITSSLMLRDSRYAVEVKVVTKYPYDIEDIILNKFEHSATILQAEGMYTKESYKMVITIMTERELAEFRKIMKDYKDTFIYYSGGIRVQGDFQFNEHNIQP